MVGVRPGKESSRAESSDGPVSPGGGLTQLVARVMARQGLTRDAVARAGGLSVATVAAIRAGTRGKRPRLPTLHRLARGLGIPAETVIASAGIAASRDLASEQERVILSLLRRMSVQDQQLAERLLRELIRSRDLAMSMSDPVPPQVAPEPEPAPAKRRAKAAKAKARA